MRLPRRVPWASIGELEQVCSWIYTDEHDLDSKVLAINRLSAWKAITTLPHALESTLSLLVVVTHDIPHASMSNLSLRQSYATAIIRLVNGLVDPLQLGTYARSIASIAKQLGLPSWLVELRHAATHEELPSLPLLREAARQSLSWLLHNYFLPMINPQPTPSAVLQPLRPLKPILKQYKECMKIVSRDASLATTHKDQLTALMKSVERWLSEAAVAANVTFGELAWESSTEQISPQSPETLSEQELKARWALDRLCDELLEKGALVPLSKKLCLTFLPPVSLSQIEHAPPKIRKRILPSDSFLPPGPSIAIWAPLLQFIQLQHTDFAFVIATRICSLLAPDSTSSGDIDPSEANRDSSYLACLSRWGKWVVDSLSDSGSKDDLCRDVVTQLLLGLGRVMPLPNQHKASALELAQVLCQSNADLEEALVLVSGPTKQVQSQAWEATSIAVMQRRLEALQKSTLGEEMEGRGPVEDGSVPPPSFMTLVPGWTMAGDTWRPCPIGVFSNP